MLSADQQRALRQELLQSLTPENKYDRAALQVRFKQTLQALARNAPLSADELQSISQASGSEVFQRYAVGGAGEGIGLFAMIRVYGKLHGPGPAAELRERMQRLAEANAMGGAPPPPQG